MTKKEVTLKISDAINAAREYRDEQRKKFNLPDRLNSHFFSDYTAALIQEIEHHLEESIITPAEAVMCVLGGAYILQSKYIDKPREAKNE